MANEDSISKQIDDGVCRIMFYHPKGNSLPGHILSDLADSITEAAKNEEIRVIILGSRGEGAFCGGAFFDELLAIDNFEQGKAFFMGFAHVINAMRKCPKFIIGRIHGKAVGGGVGLAAAADYALATKAASIKLSELALGIGPFVVGPAVKRKIGTSAFGTLSIHATQWNSAQWAAEKGLYTNLFDHVNELDEAINTLARQLCKSSLEAMAELKRVLWEDTGDWDNLLEHRAEISGRLVLSNYTRNFIEEFKSR